MKLLTTAGPQNTASLRAKRSNPEVARGPWIASSASLPRNDALRLVEARAVATDVIHGESTITMLSYASPLEVGPLVVATLLTNCDAASVIFSEPASPTAR